MEDNDRILDLYKTKYGFDISSIDLVLEYTRFVDLKIKPLENYSGDNDQQRQLARFHDYCKGLMPTMI